MGKGELDFDLDAVIRAIESINSAEVFDSPIEYDEDDPDAVVNAFLDALDDLTDEEIRQLPNSLEILKLQTEGIPDRFFGEGDEDGSLKKEDDSNDSDDDNADEQEDSSEADDSEDDNSDEQTDDPEIDDSEDGNEPESDNSCPNFGSYDPDEDECQDCQKDFPDEHKACKKATLKENPPKEEKPKKEIKEEKPKGKPGRPKKEIKEEPKEEKPKGKPGRPKKAASQEEPKEEKPKGKPGRPKKDASKEVDKEDKPKEAKRSFRKEESTKETNTGAKKGGTSSGKKLVRTSCTGMQFADFFKRISCDGAIKDCIIDSRPEYMFVRAMSPSEGIFATVTAPFSIGYDGLLGIGDISKLIKFATNVGDAEMSVDITNERIILKSANTRLKLLLVAPDTVQCVPSKDTQDIEGTTLANNCDVSAIITGENAKRFAFNTGLVKSDALTINFEKNRLSLDGGTNATDMFSIDLGEPVYEEHSNPVHISISAVDFASVLKTVKASDSPIEFMLSTDGDDIVVIRSNTDIWAFASVE